MANTCALSHNGAPIAGDVEALVEVRPVGHLWSIGFLPLRRPQCPPLSLQVDQAGPAAQWPAMSMTVHLLGDSNKQLL